jgi:hypothetical protein
MLLTSLGARVLVVKNQFFGNYTTKTRAPTQKRQVSGT